MKIRLLFLSVFLSAALFGQNVYIPDANFKAYLVGNSDINTNGDSEIQVSEASSFDGLINCSNLNISNLMGIEAFILLSSLTCSDNQLISLDLSMNNALESLECSNNELISLDVSHIPFLFYLRCDGNQITSLDVDINTELFALFCNDNELTSLDVSQHIDLTQLFCHNNDLNCVKINSNLFQGWESFLNNNTALTCIEVNELPTANNDVSIDAQMYYSLNCNYSSSCFTTSLTELSTSKNLIQILDMMGRETSFKPNTPLIYVYDDGSIEKVFSVEY